MPPPSPFRTVVAHCALSGAASYFFLVSEPRNSLELKNVRVTKNGHQFPGSYLTPAGRGGGVQMRQRVIPRGDPRESNLGANYPTDFSSQSTALSVRWSSAPMVLKYMPCTSGGFSTMRRACHRNPRAT